MFPETFFFGKLHFQKFMKRRRENGAKVNNFDKFGLTTLRREIRIEER
jgi:hypothetical protein